MTKSGLKLGFIGLGIMGTPMVMNLIKGGHVLFVNTRSKVPQELVDAGATVCTNPAGVAERGLDLLSRSVESDSLADGLYRFPDGEAAVARWSEFLRAHRGDDRVGVEQRAEGEGSDHGE